MPIAARDSSSKLLDIDSSPSLSHLENEFNQKMGGEGRAKKRGCRPSIQRGSAKELEVLIKLWKLAVPLFFLFHFFSLSLPPPLFFLSSFERNYPVPRGLSRSSPRRKTDFHTFPLCKFLLKKKPPPCFRWRIDGGRRGSLPVLIPKQIVEEGSWIEKIAG